MTATTVYASLLDAYDAAAKAHELAFSRAKTRSDNARTCAEVQAAWAPVKLAQVALQAAADACTAELINLQE